jgi:DNA-binding CsgD family transcriptional regulator
MLVFGTEMHIVTLVFVLLELVMFGIQLGYYLNRPEDKARFWYLILLFLLLIYNITGGLFPDPEITALSLQLQNIIAYGSGFMMASYFPFYFYKAFGLKLLRFHALYGVPLFLLLPYLTFFVISYSFTNNLDLAIKYGVIIPFFYSFVVLRSILIAIRVAYRQNRNKKYHIEKIAVYCAVIPWTSMTILAYFQFGQLIEVLFTNIGFLVITAMFIFNAVVRNRNEYHKLQNIVMNGIRPELFNENCLQFQLTSREIEVIKLLREGYYTSEISAHLHIAERTVTTHIQNMMSKTNTHSRLELLRKLEYGIFDV